MPPPRGSETVEREFSLPSSPLLVASGAALTGAASALSCIAWGFSATSAFAALFVASCWADGGNRRAQSDHPWRLHGMYRGVWNRMAYQLERSGYCRESCGRIRRMGTPCDWKSSFMRAARRTGYRRRRRAHASRRRWSPWRQRCGLRALRFCRSACSIPGREGRKRLAFLEGENPVRPVHCRSGNCGHGIPCAWLTGVKRHEQA